MNFTTASYDTQRDELTKQRQALPMVALKKTIR